MPMDGAPENLGVAYGSESWAEWDRESEEIEIAFAETAPVFASARASFAAPARDPRAPARSALPGSPDPGFYPPALGPQSTPRASIRIISEERDLPAQRHGDGAGPGAGEDDGCACPVCYKPLFRACISQCGHALCPDCVRMLSRGFRATVQRLGGQRVTEGDLPRCPSCRMAVYEGDYRRCYGLEKAAQSLYAAEWAEAQRAGAGSGSLAPDSPEEPASFEDLLAWNAAQKELAVKNVMGSIWVAVQEHVADSTALLVSSEENFEPDEDLNDYGPVARRGARSVQARATSSPVWASATSWAPATAPVPAWTLDGPARRASLAPRRPITALWACTDEIARRLAEKGLKLTAFRFRGKDHALITWPPISAPGAPFASLARPGS